ncbi:MAG TPA: PilZ domain-containing protein [Sphingomonadaceae bacterium]|nr:PilZ domain-containing protein [Sphingomonadaceae bacterium]
MGATIQKRSPKRSRVLLSARIECAGGQQDVRIRDVSLEGAMIESSSPPPVGEQIGLSCGDTHMNGKVAWVDAPWFGLEFSEPLRGSDLADAAGNTLKVSAPKAYRHDRLPELDEAVDVDARIIRFRPASK